MKTTPQLSCVAEDWMLLGGGVLYGFTRVYDSIPDLVFKQRQNIISTATKTWQKNTIKTHTSTYCV